MKIIPPCLSGPARMLGLSLVVWLTAAGCAAAPFADPPPPPAPIPAEAEAPPASNSEQDVLAPFSPVTGLFIGPTPEGGPDRAEMEINHTLNDRAHAFLEDGKLGYASYVSPESPVVFMEHLVMAEQAVNVPFATYEMEISGPPGLIGNPRRPISWRSNFST